MTHLYLPCLICTNESCHDSFVLAVISACVTSCNTLQHTATHRNTLQHTATQCNTLQHTYARLYSSMCDITCNTLQHTATHCYTPQHTATHCNTHMHICISSLESLLVCVCDHCNTLQFTATHCDTMQHTATHICTSEFLHVWHNVQHNATYRCNTHNSNNVVYYMKSNADSVKHNTKQGTFQNPRTRSRA